MAKIKIPFNGTDYSIDESALVSAKDSLKTHLSTVMNGSGGGSGGEENAIIYAVNVQDPNNDIVYNGNYTELSQCLMEQMGFTVTTKLYVVDTLPDTIDAPAIDMNNKTLEAIYYVIRETGVAYVVSNSGDDGIAILVSSATGYPYHGIISDSSEATEDGFYTIMTTGSSTDGSTIITFDGTDYSVDSTKLSTATDGFVAHIETLKGGGLEPITWDGVLDPNSQIGYGEFGYLSKVSNIIPTREDLIGATVELSNGLSGTILQDSFMAGDEKYPFDEEHALIVWVEFERDGETFRKPYVVIFTGINENIDGLFFGRDAWDDSYVTSLTFAGGGSTGGDTKLIINGTEYLVDSTKLSDAIADLHEALDNLRPLLGLYSDDVMIMLWDELLSTGAIKLEDGALSIGTGVSIEEPTSPELNEYGFYFNIPYNAYLYGMKVGFVFFEDGSIEMLQNGQVVNTAPAGSVSYGDSSVDMSIMNMGVCMFSADGTSVEMDGIKLTCGEPELNEYGFYYGEQYIATAVNGTSMALAFYEDGSVAALTNGQVEDVLPAGSAIYSHGNIDMSAVGFGSGVVSEDGTSITFATLKNTFSLKGKAADLPGSLIVPDDGSITSINDEGFRDCAGLISIEIPNSVTSIGANAFTGCAKLTNVTFNNLEGWYVSKTKGATGGLAPMLADANANATYLKSTYCNYYWYKSESSSYSVELKNNMADMGTATFTDEYNGLTSINLVGENTVTMTASIANSSYVFVGWYSGDTLLSSSTTYTHTFTSGQTVEARFDINYTSFTVTSSNRDEIGYTGEDGENLVIPKTFQGTDGTWYKVTGIRYGAFGNCTNLESVVIPASVTQIQYDKTFGTAFRGCTNLKSVTFAENSQLSSIADYTFKDLTGLTSIEIPASVTSIGYGAFYNCTSLENVAFEENSQLTSIGDSAFTNCSSLMSIEIPAGVTYVGGFNGCTTLENVTFGENSRLDEIAPGAFENCTALTNIELPTSVTWIRQAAFKNCTGLTSIDISNATTFEHQAFMGCTGLTSIEILSAKTLGDEVFRDCSNVTSVTIGSSVTSIGPIAFGGMSSLEVVYYEGTLEQWCKISYSAVQLGGIGANPCSNGADLYINGNLAKDIVIPNTVTAIRQYAFPGCTSLTSVEIPESVTSIGVFAFTNCSHLESVTILEGTATIGQSAFNNCVSLTSVTIPASVTTIGKYAFQNCTKLNTITYNGTVAQWNAITKQTNWKYYVPATHAICSDGTVAL